jgi:hypothetical protein
MNAAFTPYELAAERPGRRAAGPPGGRLGTLAQIVDNFVGHF